MTEVSAAAMASWLLHHVEWLRHHRAGHEAVEEITNAVYEVLRVVDRPNNRSTFAIGPCPELGCVGEVRVFIPAREDRPAFMVCAACGARWDSLQFMNAGKRIHGEQSRRIAPYVDSATAAVALGVSVRTVRRWIINDPDRDILGYPADLGYAPSRKLTNYGTAGRILLDLAEIEQLRTRRDAAVSA